MASAQMHLEHLDPTAGLWIYQLAGDQLVVEGLRQTNDRHAWQAADREEPLYLRLAGLAVMDGTGTAVLIDGWRALALAFANLYGPPVGSRRLALARAVPVRCFALEALVLRWAVHLQACLPSGEKRSRIEAAKAALQIRALVPEVPESTFLVHPRPPRAEGQVTKLLGSSMGPEEQVPASLPPDEVQRRLRKLQARVGSHELWAAAADVLASLINMRLVGVTPICLPNRSRSGLPQPGLGFTFPSPLARIWYGLWQDAVGMKLLDCEWCHKPFLVTRASQRFCNRNCQCAAGVERHRRKRRDRDLR
jgi:hypothetical protein